jgi:integrase
MREKLTPAVVKKHTDAKAPVVVWDASMPGFGLMVTAAGHRSWLIQYKHHGKSHRRNLSGVLDLSSARKEAKVVLGQAAAGKDPIGTERQKAKEDAQTLEVIFRRYVDLAGKKLRSIDRQISDMERLVLPVFGRRPIAAIKRSEIVDLLDEIETERGAHMAHQVLTYLSKLFTWHAIRDEDFLTPVRRGMARIKKSEHTRDRILEDHELRALWAAAETDTGPWGAYVQFLLLTATRRNEAARMTWSELAGDDWIIPPARMKTKVEHLVPLSPAARAVLERIPRTGPYVFETRRGPMQGFGHRKGLFDAAAGLSNYRLHDLRRTARSLMSRAGVGKDHGERVLAHKIGGVSGVYDRHEYYEEKKAALEALAGQIDRIVHPVDNVIALRG